MKLFNKLNIIYKSLVENLIKERQKTKETKRRLKLLRGLKIQNQIKNSFEEILQASGISPDDKDLMK
jgi:hypothetical protein